MTSELITIIGDQEVGRVRRGAQGRLSFIYADTWRQAEHAYPLSLSMSLAAAEHGPSVEAFLWGLLPDNERVLDRWARKFQVSARNVFALLTHVGEDCAGAAQFVTPERLDAVLGGAEDRVEWLNAEGLEERLATLRTDHAAWRLPRDVGQFSLAGAQPKTALLFDDGRWGIPSGRIPTTHILKPPTGHFDGHAENEHVCLKLARALGMPTASSQVLRFGDEIAISVERYDRVRTGGTVSRVHQEDVCQAIGVMPTIKYQNEGGPGVADIVELLRTHSGAREDDVQAFTDAVIFNWLIAGTDAHAKNYSLLISAGPRVRLAPLYDLASILPYDETDLHKVRLAMKLGGEYRLREIGQRHFHALAREARVDAERLIARASAMAEQLPDEIEAARVVAHDEGLDRPVIDRLADCLVRRAGACRTLLQA